MTNLLKLSTVLATILFWTALPATAAPPASEPSQNQEGLVYIVQPNDTLIGIALRYNLTLVEILMANDLPHSDLIFPGQKLLLPGISPPAPVVALPNQLLPETTRTHTVQPGESLYQIAGQYGLSAGALILANQLANPDLIQVGQTLNIPEGPPPAPESEPFPFTAVELSEPVIIQGRTLVVKVSLSEPEAGLSGSFEGRPLIFANNGQGSLWTIVAIHALTKPNIYPLILTARLPDGRPVSTFENITVTEGPYGLENIRLDAERGQLLDADLIRLEYEKLAGLWSQISLRPRWEGPFWYPVEPSRVRITSYFGTRRSYNNSPAAGFHAGTDFGGGVGLPIYAAAPGTVVLAEELTVRGKAVLIDHGLGLFSGYWHLSQVTVTEGQEVQPGHLLGYMGDSGLVTGPHLHWEMRLTGIAVDPLQWVTQAIP